MTWWGMLGYAFTATALGLRRLVWRKQLANGAVQPPTEVFEDVQADILLPHLDPMQRGFRNPQLARKVPV